MRNRDKGTKSRPGPAGGAKLPWHARHFTIHNSRWVGRAQTPWDVPQSPISILFPYWKCPHDLGVRSLKRKLRNTWAVFKGSIEEGVSQPVCFKEYKTSTQVSFELPLLVKCFFPSAFIIGYYTRCCRGHKRNRRHGRWGNVVTSVWTWRDGLGFKAQLYHFLNVWPWAGYLTSSGKWKVSLPGSMILRIEWDNAWKISGT